MDTRNGGHRVLWIITTFALVGSAPGHAQTLPLWVIAPAQQAERDGMRRHILEAEFAAEVAAQTSARNRRVERGRAGDGVGVAEAQAAIDTHSHNINALRRELEHLARPPNFLPSVAAPRDLHEPVRVPANAVAVASCGGVVGRPSRPQWDMFQLRGKAADATCTPSDTNDRPSRSVMWLKRSTPSDRLNADAAAVERSDAITTTSHEAARAPLLMYREPRFMLPRAFTSSSTGKAVEGSPLPLTSARFPQ